MLNEEMARILEMKIKGESITKMALELNTSESTISRRISELKRKIKRIIWQELEKSGSFFCAIISLGKENKYLLDSFKTIIEKSKFVLFSAIWEWLYV